MLLVRYDLLWNKEKTVFFVTLKEFPWSQEGASKPIIFTKIEHSSGNCCPVQLNDIKQLGGLEQKKRTVCVNITHLVNFSSKWVNKPEDKMIKQDNSI